MPKSNRKERATMLNRTLNWITYFNNVLSIKWPIWFAFVLLWLLSFQMLIVFVCWIKSDLRIAMMCAVCKGNVSMHCLCYTGRGGGERCTIKIYLQLNRNTTRIHHFTFDTNDAYTGLLASIESGCPHFNGLNFECKHLNIGCWLLFDCWFQIDLILVRFRCHFPLASFSKCEQNTHT